MDWGQVKEKKLRFLSGPHSGPRVRPDLGLPPSISDECAVRRSSGNFQVIPVLSLEMVADGWWVCSVGRRFFSKDKCATHSPDDSKRSEYLPKSGIYLYKNHLPCREELLHIQDGLDRPVTKVSPWRAKKNMISQRSWRKSRWKIRQIVSRLKCHVSFYSFF